ncbi:MAG TPA: hypothetical protein VFP98_10230, partial [Candidatus Polarisedimenticolia bacterium]|nr:hypothetical protein [Candidatus Polarisedimenticolia bacterium]
MRRHSNMARRDGCVVTSRSRAIQMLIYVITDRRARPDLGAERLVDEVVGSGADMVQIREKVLPAVEQLRLCRRAV